MTLVFEMAQFFDIKTGLEDFFRPYSAVILPTNKSIQRQSIVKHGAGYWSVNVDFDIMVSAKRLARDNVDVQLGNVEREIQRICCQYHNGDIRDVEDMTYLGQQRIYGLDSNYAKSNWATRILIRVRFGVANTDPYPV